MIRKVISIGYPGIPIANRVTPLEKPPCFSLQDGAGIFSDVNVGL